MKQQIENIIKNNLPPSENSSKDKPKDRKHKHDFKAFTVLFECECGEKIAVEPSKEAVESLVLLKNPNENNE